MALLTVASFFALSALCAGGVGVAVYAGGIAMLELVSLLPSPPPQPEPEIEPEDYEGEPVFERLLRQLPPPPPPTVTRPTMPRAYRHRFMAPDRIHPDDTDGVTGASDPFIDIGPVY
jgi:hypothetical protein